MRIEYCYDDERCVSSPDHAATHERICHLLELLRQDSRISQFVIRTHRDAFPTEETKQQLFSTLGDFSIRHHVGLARVFGSRKHGFCYLPAHFLLVHQDERLSEVFPCRIADTEIDPIQFLTRLAEGKAWTLQSVPSKATDKHERLVEWLVNHAAELESGLKLVATNVQVSREFGERGYVDVVFEDADGHYLLVEVKTTPQELDKAVGQIMRHRDLFTKQNNLQKQYVRIAVACPHIPDQFRQMTQEVGIQCFQLVTLDAE